MAGDFLRQRIGDQLSGAVLLFNPGRVRQGDPDRATVNQELDVHCIGVAGGDGYDQGLVEAVYLFLGPAVGGGEVSEHKKIKTRISVKTGTFANISPSGVGGQTVAGHPPRALDLDVLDEKKAASFATAACKFRP